MFAAAVGQHYDSFIETKNQAKGAGFRWEGPAKDKLTSAHYLALSKTKDIAIILDDNKSYEILAGYANGGFKKIREWSEETQTQDGFLNEILNTMASISSSS